VDWVVIGAASDGPGIHQPDPAWVTNLIDYFGDMDVPIFFKGNLAGNPAADPWREEFPRQTSL
jgi:protein gp37